MKTIHSTLCGLTAILLLGLTTSTFAQNAKQQRAMQEQMQRQAIRHSMNSMWSGDGANFMLIGLLSHNDFREGLGISEEQYQKLQDTGGTVQGSVQNAQNDPNVRAIQAEMVKLMMTEMPGGPFAENVSEAAQKKLSDLQSRMATTTQEAIARNLASAINENLTPEQLRKFREFQISTMSEAPFVTPSMFEALDLSDDQRQQLGDIKKGMEPEFKKWVDKTIDAKLRFSEKLLAEYIMQVDGTTTRLSLDNIPEVEEKIRKAHPELVRELNEIMESGRKLADKLKVEMFDVLTDEQWERMLNLIDNPPDYARKMIARMREKRENTNASTGAWRPGLDSWKPGDAIPEQYRKERNERRRFPKTEE